MTSFSCARHLCTAAFLSSWLGWASPLQAGAIQLSADFFNGGGVLTSFRVNNPVGDRAVFLAAASSNAPAVLFSTPVRGGTPIQLSPALVGTLRSFKIVPDGSRVIYLADQTTSNQVEIFSVPITGGTPTRLNPDLASPNSDVLEFDFTPDGQSVVYRADQLADERFELFRVPLAGGMATSVLPPLSGGQDVERWAFTPNGQRLVYISDALSGGVDEIFSVLVNGSMPTRLNADPVTNGDTLDFLIAPDSSRVVFRGDIAFNDTNELFSAPVDGSAAAIRLATNVFPQNGDVDSGYAISPDSSWVAYRADAITDAQSEIFGAPIAMAGLAQRLNRVMTNASMDAESDLAFAGSTVIYRSEERLDNRRELFAAPADASAPSRLLGELGNNRNVQDFIILPNGTNIVYRGDVLVDDVQELFLTDPSQTNGGIPFSGPIGGFGDVTNRYLATADGSLVIYAVDSLANEEFQIYAVPLADPAQPIQLNDPLPSGGFLWNDFQLADGETRLVYRGTQRSTNHLALFSTLIRRPESQFQSDPPPGSTLEFGSIAAGGSGMLNLSVSEVGTRTLTVQSPGSLLSGPAASSFQLTTPLPLSIPDGGSAQPLALSCNPASGGLLEATLTLETSDPLQPTVQYFLRATGPTAAGGTTGSATAGSDTGAGTGGTGGGGSSGTGAGGTAQGGTAGFVALDELPWRITLKRPRPFRALKFKPGTKGFGTFKGIVERTGLPKKSSAVLVELAVQSGASTNAASSSNAAAPAFVAATRIGRVSKSGSAPFVAKFVGASNAFPSGSDVHLLVRASTNFALASTRTQLVVFVVK